MSDASPIIQADPGTRPADRLAAGVAALALLASIAATVWFFAGFVENDTELRATSSALLLSLGLGAFAIIPTAIVLRRALNAWRRGFGLWDGVWTLLMMVPWVGLAVVMLARSVVPGWAAAGALIFAALLCLWAGVSLVFLRRDAR